MELLTFIRDEVKGLPPERIAILGQALVAESAWTSLPTWMHELLELWAELISEPAA